MKRRIARSLLWGALLTLAALPAAKAEDIKLGYVDMRRALEETEEGRRARGAIKKDFEQKQKELDERQEELRKQIEDLDKKRTLLPADKVREKEVEIQKNLQQTQQTYLRHQEDLQKKESQALQPLVERMQRIVSKISSSENFTMVLDKNQAGIVFAKPHLDLTNELIRRLNSGEGAAGKAAAPKPAAGGAKGKK